MEKCVNDWYHVLDSQSINTAGISINSCTVRRHAPSRTSSVQDLDHTGAQTHPVSAKHVAFEIVPIMR